LNPAEVTNYQRLVNDTRIIKDRFEDTMPLVYARGFFLVLSIG